MTNKQDFLDSFHLITSNLQNKIEELERSINNVKQNLNKQKLEFYSVVHDLNIGDTVCFDGSRYKLHSFPYMDDFYFVKTDKGYYVDCYCNGVPPINARRIKKDGTLSKHFVRLDEYVKDN